ncbi:signal peptidase I [Streptomyces sp. CB01881]|uniref:signal peptidase I n=1 Tax=Streptomyces sp. CB01881 TaxID=2078691 RepID=UPI000CDBD558|nr:signal peptidase I [Streptomyces sp. CB01881]AUY47872.1 signal peptidase I [Streptomyces sp. CB01881]TYC76346.1 signal peptidase I [Streptomyces sp. CB01881]
MSGENTAETGGAGAAATADGAAPAGGAVSQGGGAGPEAGAEPGDGAEPGAGTESGEGKQRRKRPFWQELPILVLVALVLSLGIKTFFVQAFSIPSGSMQHTLEKNDRVLVDKLTPWFGARPERGEVVVFRDPGGWLETAPEESGNSVVRGVRKALGLVGLMPSQDEKDLIKRVIAVGGDTVECNAGSPVKVNGVALDEPYVYPGATPCGDSPVGTVKVPKDRIWVMGDHRNNSRDSRYHVNEPGGGFVPVDNVIGRAFVVAWPVSRWDTLPVPGTFDRKALDDQGAFDSRQAQAGPAGAGGADPLEELPAPEAAALAAVVPPVLWQRRRGARRDDGTTAARG